MTDQVANMFSHIWRLSIISTPVHEVDLRISSIVNNKMFEVKSALIIPVVKFNIPS